MTAVWQKQKAGHCPHSLHPETSVCAASKLDVFYGALTSTTTP